MRLQANLYRANLMLASVTIDRGQSDERFSRQLERCLVDACHELNIPLPLWMEKNTKEFARFHQTLFFREQFSDPIMFDRLQIRWMD